MPKSPSSDKLFSIGEVAEYLQLSRRSVERLLANGSLGKHRIGSRTVRISGADLQAFLARSRKD